MPTEEAVVKDLRGIGVIMSGREKGRKPARYALH
jgi:hypothetical protein